MSKYPENYNPIVEYYEAIESGKIITSIKVKTVYKKLVQDMANPLWEWEYSSKRAIHAIDFIECFCKHSKGKWGGKPIYLELWQKALLAAIFGIIHKIDLTRKFREIFLMVARKNGKSVLASGIALYLLIADGEPGAEIYSLATKRDQAKIVWDESKRMIMKSPVLNKRLKRLVGEIQHPASDSSFKPLCSDSNSLDGLNVHGAIIDELHEIKDKNLYDVVVDGTSAREQPLVLIITTAGTTRDNIFDLKYDEANNVIFEINGYKDERFFPVVYELDERKEWTDEKTWIKANPNLGVSKFLDQVQNKVNKAKNNPILVPNLLTKDFNIRETSSQAWLTFEQAVNEETFDIAKVLTDKATHEEIKENDKKLKPTYGIGGVDLSRTTDLCSACMLFQVPNNEKIFVKHMYWLPEELLEKRVHEDKVPYDIWLEQGLLRVCRGNNINPHDVTEWYLELMQEHGLYLFQCGYDSWSAKLWVEEMKNCFGDVMTPVIQGKKTLSNPMRLMGAHLESKLINYDNNSITRMCLINTSIDVDKNDNIQPCKTSNQKQRIDGTAAMLDAFVVFNDRKDDYTNLIAG